MSYCIDLSNKVAVITGAAKGIGRATAKILTQAGAQVIIDDILPHEDIQVILDDIEQVGLRPFYVQADISNKEDRKSVV